MMSVKVEKLYATPVLLSGLGTLVLSSKEINLIEQHYRETLRQLLRLHKNSPRSVVYFLAGSLPGSALLHQRQLNLFGMISRLNDTNLLYKHALAYFSSACPFNGSWFKQIINLSVLYSLPHPSTILTNPPSKAQFKNLVKKNVISYWEIVLRGEALQLKSLSYFSPNFMSLLKPHPLWTTAESNPLKVTMATVQAVMLSGRYRCGSLTRHWSPSSSGFCLLSPTCNEVVEDLTHILQHCPALSIFRSKLLHFTISYASNLPFLLQDILVRKCCPDYHGFCRFVLDCSSDPEVIHAYQIHGQAVHFHLFAVTRVWVYVLHRERLKMLGRWYAP